MGVILVPPLLQSEEVMTRFTPALRLGAQAAVSSLESLQVRLISSLCGLSVGMAVVCLAAAFWDDLAAKRASHNAASMSSTVATTASVASGSAAAAGSRPLLDLMARKLVRKNSRLAVEQAYAFAAAPPLGVGSYGVVYRATHRRTGIERALKRIDKQAAAEAGLGPAALLREVEAQRLMDHPHVCRLVEYFETDRYLWLVMELCHGEELCDHLLRRQRGLPEMEAARLMKQMLRATLHCHGRHVVHRDLKPENFLFLGQGESDVLKLVDFGLSVPLPGSAVPEHFGTMVAETPPPETSAGTLLYRSPQALRGEPASEADDAWSLGVIFHILLTGTFPFSTNDDQKFKELCARGRLPLDLEARLESLRVRSSPLAADLAAQLLEVEPTERLSVQDALQHPFFATSGTEMPPPLEAEGVVERMEHFLSSCRLRRIAAAAAAQLLDGQHSSATFLALDRAGDGRVAPEDLREYASSQGLHVPPAWVDGLSQAWPSLGEPAGIGYTAFAAATLDEASLAGDAGLSLCGAVFDRLDADHDGSLSTEDLQRRLGLPASDCEQLVTEALAVAAAGGQQSANRPLAALGFEDFVAMMRSPPPRAGSGAAAATQ